MCTAKPPSFLQGFCVGVLGMLTPSALLFAVLLHSWLGSATAITSVPAEMSLVELDVEQEYLQGCIEDAQKRLDCELALRNADVDLSPWADVEEAAESLESLRRRLADVRRVAAVRARAEQRVLRRVAEDRPPID